MEDLSLHVLDVAENALTAGADRVDVRVLEETKRNSMRIEIEDDGCGMDERTSHKVLDPFYTTKPGKRVGLGLALLAQAAREAGGDMTIRTAPDRGTLVRAAFQLDHIDLKPMGRMLETIAGLACAHPQVQFVYEHRRDGAVVAHWDSGSGQTTRTPPW